MSTDQLDSNQGMQSEELQWEETTVSGKIFRQLKAIGHRQGKSVSISNKDGVMETFAFGEETAYLLKRLEGGTVGNNDGNLVTYAEAYHYKRLPWWNEAIEKAVGGVELLDTPVLWAAKDSGIEGYEGIFSPSAVIDGLGLQESGGIQREKTEVKVKEIISSVISPLVGPDFEVRDFAGGLRLAPLTSEGMASRKTDNEAYKSAVGKIGQASASLGARYSELKSPTTV